MNRKGVKRKLIHELQKEPTAAQQTSKKEYEHMKIIDENTFQFYMEMNKK